MKKTLSQFVLCVFAVVAFSFSNPSLAKTDRRPSQAKGAQQVDVLYRHFLNETGLRPGSYKLTKGSPQKCEQGDLRVLKFDDDLSLMLGARALVIGLGKDVSVEEDRACRTVNHTRYGSGLIEGTRDEDCGGDKTQYKTVVKVSSEGIHYTRTTSSHGRVLSQADCTLVPGQPPVAN